MIADNNYAISNKNASSSFTFELKPSPSSVFLNKYLPPPLFDYTTNALPKDFYEHHVIVNVQDYNKLTHKQI
jgi:hypothetical protein